MEKLKRMLALVLVTLMSLSLVACGGNKEQEEPAPPAELEENVGEVGEADATVAYEETVVIAMPTEMSSPDPYGGTGAETKSMTNMTHLRLVYNNGETGKVDPVTAEKWEDVNGDGMQWRVTLKKGVVFHNGEEMTAEDVKFTWEYTHPDAGNVIAPNAASAYVDSIEVEDDYNVVFKLKNAMFDFATYLDTKIYCKSAFDSMDAAEAALIGTGPYYYDASLYQSGAQYGFTRFDGYYEGTENYPTLHIVNRVIAEEDARVAAMQAGEADVMGMLLYSPSYYSMLDAEDHLNLYSREGAMSYYMGFNYSRDYLKDVKLRQALAMAINKEDIVNVAFENGLGAAVSTNFCVPTGAGYTDVDYIEYNPEGAKEILDELGHTNKLTLDLMHYASTKKIAEVIQANLSVVGVTVNIQQVDSANWGAIKREQSAYDIFLDYATYKGALLYNYNRFFQEKGASNMNGYYNPDFETMLANVQTAGSYEDMLAEFAKLQQWCADDVSCFPLVVNKCIGVTQSDVEGYVLADAETEFNYSTLRIPARG